MNINFLAEVQKQSGERYKNEQVIKKDDRQILVKDEIDKEDNFVSIMSTNINKQYVGVILNSNLFQQHSKIETITPNESLVDYPFNPDVAQCINQHKKNEDIIKEEITTLKEENIYLRQELKDLKKNYQQFTNKQHNNKPVFSNEDVNTLIEENRLLQQKQQKLNAHINMLNREINEGQKDLQQIGRSNQELYKRVMALTNELERERKNGRNAMYEAQERWGRLAEQQQQTIDDLNQELFELREQNVNLNTILQQSNEQLQRERNDRGQLQEECETLINDVQELRQYIEKNQEDQNNQEYIAQLRETVQNKQEEVDQLKEQLQKMDNEIKSLIEEYDNLKNLYERYLKTAEQAQKTISRLQQELYYTKNQRKSLKNPSSGLLRTPSPPYNNMKTNQNTDTTPLCSASTDKRLKILSNESSRKSIMQQLRRQISLIGKIDLQNKIASLSQQLFMETQYRERTNLQMQEMVIELQNTISTLQRNRPQQSKKEIGRGVDYSHLQESLSRYERLLLAADEEKLRLMQEISLLQRENYQVRLQLANSQLDNETEQLIEQLTLQLQQEKHGNRSLQEENEHLREELIAVEKQLMQKNERIKLLSLNLNRREQGRHNRPN